ncbi:predicted protein [Lodderomyces elongisporus NRRL YB-4239]|uniref:Uncharacterized protein n=1 Tax=Lodderomyces elongisporus (strain ATCC 11503 / CBS 2605 / JCM 1781 / NBRC 1676 / NRRL YB-4239) TaxID=379508 RepID=A5DX51_LODEL|nr:predicted protein [Lodderomyces elongisporus NRRL YB-4239]
MIEEIDRKARLAALRKSRSGRKSSSVEKTQASVAKPLAGESSSNVRDGNSSFQSSETTHANTIVNETKNTGSSLDTEYLKNNSLQQEDAELETKDSTLMANIETAPKELGNSTPTPSSEQHMINSTQSCTAEMKNDLKSYLHKAEIRTNRALNRIIQESIL